MIDQGTLAYWIERTRLADELLHRLVVANHMRQHAGVRKPNFDDCREGFCGEWHELRVKDRAVAP